MQVSEKLINFIKQHEGFSSTPYKDAGGYAIGYGFNYYQNGLKVTPTDPPMSKEQAHKELLNIVIKLKKSVRALITTNVSDEQLEAVTSLVYNIGLGAFKGSTLLKLININPFHQGIPQAFLAWNKSQGKVLTALSKRREAELQMYKSTAQTTAPNAKASNGFIKKMFWVLALGFGIKKVFF